MSQLAAQEKVGEISNGAFTIFFEWKIKHYFDIPYEIDYCLDSPNIECFDATWYLRLYPNGQSAKQSPGWIGLYLVREKSITPKHCVNFTLGLKKYDGSSVTTRSSAVEFENGTAIWCGWRNFFPVLLLNQERKAKAHDGTLTVFCSMSVNKCEGVQAAVQTDALPAFEKLAHDFKNLMVNEEETDVILNVKKRKFRVHNAVLVARSSQFCAMMNQKMKEKMSRVVEINDCDPDAFQLYLEYLYSGDVEQISTDTVFELNAIADKYDAGELKTKCIQFMMDSLTVEIFCDVLALSLRHDDSELLEKAVMFLGKNLKEILVTVKWQSFVKDNPTEANELYLKAVDYYSKPH